MERTRPITPHFDMLYMGAIGKGYSPEAEAVHTINPREPVAGSGSFFCM